MDGIHGVGYSGGVGQLRAVRLRPKYQGAGLLQKKKSQAKGWLTLVELTTHQNGGVAHCAAPLE